MFEKINKYIKIIILLLWGVIINFISFLLGSIKLGDTIPQVLENFSKYSSHLVASSFLITLPFYIYYLILVAVVLFNRTKFVRNNKKNILVSFYSSLIFSSIYAAYEMYEIWSGGASTGGIGLMAIPVVLLIINYILFFSILFLSLIKKIFKK